MRVGIVGVGQTKFGKLSDSSSRELVADAFKEALSDAGIARNDISTIIVCSGSHYDKQRSPSGIMTEYVGLNPKPTFHIEAACASSGVGVRVGWSMIQAGLHDVVAVVGFQKMTELDADEVQDVMSRSGDVGVAFWSDDASLLRNARSGSHEQVWHNGRTIRLSLS